MLKSLPALALSAVLLTACAPSDGDGVAKQAIDTAQTEMDKAIKEMATENMSLTGADGTPKAEITPAGELLIDGKAVQLTDAQRAQLAKHRELLVAIASDGVAIGKEGVALAGKAVSEVFNGVLSGDNEAFEKKIEAEAKRIEQSAKTLCARLPALMASEQALAKAIPAFQPYAQMTQANVDECLSDIDTAKTPEAPEAPDAPEAPESPAQ